MSANTASIRSEDLAAKWGLNSALLEKLEGLSVQSAAMEKTRTRMPEIDFSDLSLDRAALKVEDATTRDLSAGAKENQTSFVNRLGFDQGNPGSKAR